MSERPLRATDASSKPDCSRDQEQPCCDDDDPGGSCEPLTDWSETLYCDRSRHDSHRARVHDPDD
jgi:hypothetical protein